MSSIFKFGTLLTIIGMTTAATSAHMQKGATRLASTENLMVGLVHPNFLAIEDAVKAAKKDQQNWKSLTTNAALLNEAGYLLVDDERSQGKEWDSAAEDLRRTTAAMLVQIDARNTNGITTELEAVGAACTRCHASHRNR